VKKEAAKKESLPKSVKPEESAPAPEAAKPGKDGSSAPTPGETKNENLRETADTEKAGKGPVQPVGTEQAMAVKPAPTYSVQVGYFKEVKNASTLVESLKQKGYDAFLYGGEVEKGKRVLIGRFSGRKQALEESRRLLKNEGLKTVVYRY
jgi:cell division septation protein DedD